VQQKPKIQWTLIIQIVQLIKDFSNIFKRAKKGNKEKLDTVKDYATNEVHSTGIHDDSVLSPEMILRENEPVSPNARLAQDILKNGIQCKAIEKIGSLSIEREPYYSYLFTSSPRLITNRGCITFDITNKRNIDLVQVIQLN
jgi:hypothetical protein